MWRLFFSIAMLFHGIGHILFLMNTWGYWKTASERGWPFADGLKLSQTGEGVIGVLWLAPLIGFVIATWGMFTQHAGWPPIALAAAIVSSALILVWRGSLNTSSAFFALLFDVVVLVVAIWQQRLLQPAGV
jgi:hypothetical protein